MLSNYIRHAALAATLFNVGLAQKSVPSDLSAGFGSAGTEIQVSYTGNAVEGFNDGVKFTKDEVSNEPTFALGDSSGIVPSARYTVILIDNTEDDKRILHYAQSNFKLTGEVVNIASDSTPVLAYQAPGAFKETGERKYSFLLYQHFANKELDTLKLPEEGAAFTVQSFQDDNGFKDPVGGLGMAVNLGAGGDDTPASPTAPQQQPSTTAVQEPPLTSAVQEQPSTTAVQEQPLTSAVQEPPLTSAVQEQPSATTAQEQAPTTAVQGPASTVAEEVPSTAVVASSTTIRASSIVSPVSSAVVPSTADDSQAQETSTEAAATTGRVPASSVLPGAPTSTLVIVPSSTDSPTGTLTDTAGPALQTVSGASGLALGTAGCAVGAAMMVFAGLLAW